jgi:hypothetical protein
MQTFVPYDDDMKSAACLDDRRLLKQIVECHQILRALTDPNYGWQNHPATKMWRGYSRRLYSYYEAMQSEYKKRRNKYVNVSPPVNNDDLSTDPSWWGGVIHATHRANLLRKKQEYYSTFGWTEDVNMPYFWPTKQEVNT